MSEPVSAGSWAAARRAPENAARSAPSAAAEIFGARRPAERKGDLRLLSISPPHPEMESEHVVVELLARVVVRRLSRGMRAVEPTRVAERQLLVTVPVAAKDQLGADNVEALFI